MVEAALAHLEQSRNSADPEEDEVYDELSRDFRRRLAAVDRSDDRSHEGTHADVFKKFLTLSHELLRVQRQTVLELRNQRRIGDEVLRELEYELDLGELKLQSK
jgi:hypothetical protein